MYLPPGQDEKEREKITRRFEEYADIMHVVGKKYGAVPHWAKIELPDLVKGNMNDAQNILKLKDLKQRVQKRYDIEKFTRARDMLDPDHILSNDLLDVLFD